MECLRIWSISGTEKRWWGKVVGPKQERFRYCRVTIRKKREWIWRESLKAMMIIGYRSDVGLDSPHDRRDSKGRTVRRYMGH